MKYEILDYEGMERVLKDLSDYLTKLNICDEIVFDSRLVTSELISNILQHSAGKAYFTGLVRNGFVELEIGSDEKFTPPAVSRCSTVYAESGRGLFLVDSFCERRVTTDDGVKVYIRIKE
ncbi:MAG: hypothetical protein J5993_04305 [Clostridia bacterium]|nr:hypothetical protein [Clostridia bacterium]